MLGSLSREAPQLIMFFPTVLSLEQLKLTVVGGFPHLITDVSETLFEFGRNIE